MNIDLEALEKLRRLLASGEAYKLVKKWKRDDLEAEYIELAEILCDITESKVASVSGKLN